MKQTSAVYTYQNQAKLTRWLSISFIVYIVLNVLAGLGEAYLLNMFKQAAPTIMEEGTASPAYDSLLSYESMVLYFYITVALVFVVTAVLTAKWIMRANKNARALEATEVEITPRWSVGWFFVPIMNLVMPFRSMTQIWNGSMRIAGKAATKTVLYVWWLAWIASYVVSRLSSTLEKQASKAMDAAQTHEALQAALSSFLTSGYIGLISNVLIIISALALLKIIYAVNQAQERGALRPAADAEPEAER